MAGRDAEIKIRVPGQACDAANHLRRELTIQSLVLVDLLAPLAVANHSRMGNRYTKR